MCLAESCSQTSQEDQPIPDQTSGLTQQRMTDISFNNILKKHTVLVPLAETNIRFRSYSTKLFQWTSKMFRFIPIAFSLRDVHKLVNSDRRPLSHWTNNKSESQIVKAQRRNFKWAGLIENTSSAHSCMPCGGHASESSAKQSTKLRKSNEVIGLYKRNRTIMGLVWPSSYFLHLAKWIDI